MKFERKELKNILRQMEVYDARISEIASSAEKREIEAAAIVKQLSDIQLSEQLKSLGVESVNRDKLGIRVSELKEAGIYDMESLCSMSYKQLTRLKGIGEESAYLIYTVAGKIKKELGEGIRLRISPEQRDEPSGRLLQTLPLCYENSPRK